MRVDLVARVSFLEAVLCINPVYIKDYEGKNNIKSSVQIEVSIDDHCMMATQKDNRKWIFKG